MSYPVKVAMSFYPQGGGEVNKWTKMPGVPGVGDTVHYSLSGDPDDSHAWRVLHVSWVHENGVWHAEIGLS